MPDITVDEPLCARCAGQGSTCCQGSSIFLTLGDMERISQAAGRTDFSEYAQAEEEDYAAVGEFDPVWIRIFNLDGSRRVLRHDHGVDCCFLTPSGCRLALEERPLVCRLYPFDYNRSLSKPERS